MPSRAEWNTVGHMTVVDAGAEIIRVEPGLKGKARTERKTCDIQGVIGAVKVQTPFDLACVLLAQGHGPSGGVMDSIGRAVMHLTSCARGFFVLCMLCLVFCI